MIKGIGIIVDNDLNIFQMHAKQNQNKKKKRLIKLGVANHFVIDYSVNGGFYVVDLYR